MQWRSRVWGSGLPHYEAYDMEIFSASEAIQLQSKQLFELSAIKSRSICHYQQEVK